MMWTRAVAPNQLTKMSQKTVTTFWLGDTNLDDIGEGPSDYIMTFRREFVPASFWKELSLQRLPPRNATFYQKHSTFSVYEDCPTTLAQMAMKFMVDLVAVKRRTADSLCSSIKEALPSPNIFLPSTHLLKKVAGVECAFRYAHHVCPNDCMVWPWLPPKVVARSQIGCLYCIWPKKIYV